MNNTMIITPDEVRTLSNISDNVNSKVLGVNPFDQPGVESYKKNMFALLGKPGFEDIKKALEAKI